MSANYAPLFLGAFSSASELANDLGNVYWIGSGAYKLVTATAAITTPRYKVCTADVTLGVPSNGVTVSASVRSQLVAGVISSDYGTTTIPISNYFLIQVSGYGLVLADTTAMKIGTILASATGGEAGLFALTGSLSAQESRLGAVFGRATKSAGVVTAGNAIPFKFSGLL